MRLAEQTGAEIDRLVGLDRDVPGLPLVLDDDALHDWLVRFLGDGPGLRARRSYLRWKPGAGGVVRVRLDDGGAGEDLYLAVWHRDSAAKLDKTVMRGGRAVLAVDHDRLAVLARPAADRALPGLGRLHTAGAASTLRRLHPVDESAHRLLRRSARHEATVRTLAYKPQRRWVGLLGDPPDVPTDPTLVLRAYRPAETADLERRHRAAREVLGDGVAGLLGVDTRRGLLAVGHVPGATLDVLGPQDSLAAARGAGALLARLHGARPGTGWEALPVRGVAQEQDDVRAAATTLELLVPGAGAAAAAERLLAALQPQGSEAPVLLHGDLSADQVVVGHDGSTTLIDLDEVGRGPASHDLAGAAASWALADPETAAARLTALLDGYAPLAPLPPPAPLRARTAAHVLRRAPEAFRAGSPAWPTQVRAAVALAHDVLDGTAVVP